MSQESHIDPPLTITFVNFADDWGGGEGWTLRAAQGLAERGHRVDLVGRVGGPFATHVRDAGLPYRELPVSYDYKPETVHALRSHYRNTGTQVTIVHHNKDVRTAGVAARMNRISVVHRNGFPIIKNTWRHRITMRFVDRILTNSDQIHDRYRKYRWLNRTPIDVVPNGISPAKTPEPTGLFRRVFGEDTLIALFSGRMTGVKQADLLLRAFAELPKESIWRLALVGDGRQRKSHEEVAIELQLAERVHFFGFRSDARAMAGEADLMLLPSRDEGMPNSLMEAMAAGVPVAATPVGDVPFLLDHGKAGWLLSMDNPAEWTDLLRKIERNRDSLKEMGNAGQERILKEFRIDRMLDGVEKSLRAALKQPGGH